MAIIEGLAGELERASGFIQKTASCFTDEDATFAPNPEMYTVAGHLAHAADSVDWFVEGAFGEGWDMDFEGLIAKAKAVSDLGEARDWVERSFKAAADRIRASNPDELYQPIPDTRIMEGAPRIAIVSAIVDHTAHHRGALAVYARLVGKTPDMPYA